MKFVPGAAQDGHGHAAAGPVIHWLVLSASAMQPSSEVASFSVTKRPPESAAREEAGHGRLRFAFQSRADLDSDARPPQPFDAGAIGALIGVGAGDDDACTPASINRLSAARATRRWIRARWAPGQRRPVPPRAASPA